VANRVPSAVTLQRKCWWDGIEIELKQAGEDAPRNIKLWARRVWTLELSLVRIFLRNADGIAFDMTIAGLNLPSLR
jgi:hypothetical protein